MNTFTIIFFGSCFLIYFFLKWLGYDPDKFGEVEKPPGPGDINGNMVLDNYGVWQKIDSLPEDNQEYDYLVNMALKNMGFSGEPPEVIELERKKWFCTPAERVSEFGKDDDFKEYHVLKELLDRAICLLKERPGECLNDGCFFPFNTRKDRDIDLYAMYKGVFDERCLTDMDILFYLKHGILERQIIWKKDGRNGCKADLTTFDFLATSVVFGYFLTPKGIEFIQEAEVLLKLEIL